VFIPETVESWLYSELLIIGEDLNKLTNVISAFKQQPCGEKGPLTSLLSFVLKDE